MQKKKWNLNTIYISERLQEALRPIAYCALTTVVAPMGYGKTTAINWFLSERAKTEEIDVIRISVYSDNLTIFWKSVQAAFSYAGFEFLNDYPCPGDQAGGSLLADTLCHELGGSRPCFIFIDDFHVMVEPKVSDFLCVLVKRLPENVHFIIASRDRFLPAGEILELGNNAYSLGIDNLRLNHTELSIYAHRCGTQLTDEQVKRLLYSSEGWFSAIYLNLRTLFEHGMLPDKDSDIYTIFTAAMIDPLPEEQREFLAVMGIADEFTADMAEFVTGNPDAENIIKSMTEQNAFVTCLPDKISYRFHHMMKECAERTFRSLSKEKQNSYINRYGDWYEEHELYLHAIEICRLSENYEKLLVVIQKDAGILISSLNSEGVINDLEKIPTETLKKYPFSILVLMRCMFNWHEIPRMLKLKAIFMEAISEQPDMDPVEMGNLLGECDLITSFLLYNDISAMSRLHRCASAHMSRTAISVSSSGGWTFGSPSVIMMFHRDAGELEKELSEMDECMPHYYKITNNHGMGAEKIMRAEAMLMKGNFEDAKLELELAYARVEDSSQENMALCCDFTQRRLMLCRDIKERCSFEQRYKELLSHRNIAQINIWYATAAYYYALLGEIEKIPEIFRDHKLRETNILSPGKPMYEMIENQVYLAQGDYAKVIIRSDELLGQCEDLHYAMVELHLFIQNAAAYEKIGKRKEALNFIKTAIQEAMPDELLLPFVENYQYIEELLEAVTGKKEQEFASRIKELSKSCESRKNKKKDSKKRPEAFSDLTEREYEIALLMQTRISNREIAEKLFLSEGSVKQYVNQIYSKLRIDGDRRTKRQQLFELFENE